MIALTIHVPDGRIADFLSAEADKRSCLPEQMALALMSCTAASGLADAILDGFEPAAIPRAVPRRSSLQVRVLRALPHFLAPNGTVVASMGDIAHRLGTENRGAVRNAVANLVRKGLVELLLVGTPNYPSRYRITAAGETFLEETR